MGNSSPWGIHEGDKALSLPWGVKEENQVQEDFSGLMRECSQSWGSSGSPGVYRASELRHWCRRGQATAQGPREAFSSPGEGESGWRGLALLYSSEQEGAKRVLAVTSSSRQSAQGRAEQELGFRPEVCQGTQPWAPVHFRYVEREPELVGSRC